jgi:phosphohistidine phosphatase SixA
LPIEIYGPTPDSAFVSLLRSKRKNVLIVGHSNTVDDIVNMLCGEIKIPGDLKDNEYGNLFIVKKKGRKFFFKRYDEFLDLIPLH